MRNDKDNLKIAFIKRRAVLLQAGYIILTAILLLKLFKLQIFDFFLYKRKARNNSVREEFLLPKRGIIYDRNMVQIATTEVKYKAVYHTAKKGDIREIEKIYQILNRPASRWRQVFKTIQKQLPKSKHKTFILARNLTNKEITKLKFNQIYLPKMGIDKYYARNYPFKNYTSVLIGYVAGVRQTDNKVATLNADYKIGISGTEKHHETTLGGKIGFRNNIIDATGKIIDSVNIKKQINGDKIITTIDQNLQNKLSQLLEGKNGAATLLDIKTGDILAMVSTPNIDPNLMSMGISNDDMQDIINSQSFQEGLFVNKNISATYPPGSTFKVVSSLAGLINGIDPNAKYKCTGKHKIGNRVFHCWKDKDGGHGWVDMNKAIAQSCNCYFYNLSQQVSNEDIYFVAQQLGLCNTHLPNFDNESQGFVGNAKDVKKKYNQIWMPGDNANLALGQGWTNVTPLQLAVMVARLASGVKLEPKYLLSDHSNFKKLNINAEFLNIVRRGLFSVINEDYGIIHGIARRKYQICGKTGSAQVVSKRIENKDMWNQKVATKMHSHALFIGYAPYDDPKYAISVVVEHGIGGARSAAPIGVNMLSVANNI